MSKALKKLREERKFIAPVEQRFTLIFMDRTTEEVTATDYTEAWVKGRIRAAEKRSYLLKVEEVRR